MRKSSPTSEVNVKTRAVAIALLLGTTTIGCSDDGSPSEGGSSGSAASGTTSTGGGSATGGSAANAGAGQGSTSGRGGTDEFVNAAACGERGKANATTTDYEGTAEFFIIGEAGLGVDVCTIRYDVKRVDAGQDGCKDPVSGAACAWSHLVEYSNPTVVLNMDGACDASNSVPQLDAAGREQLDGTRIHRGFSAAAGHGDSLMKYDEATNEWVAIGRVSWSEASGALEYKINGDMCSYGH
jgi:hypothetical protein